MSEAQDLPTPVRVTGDDVILHMGCSEEWATWTVRALKQMRAKGGEVVRVDVLLLEDDGYNLVSKWRRNIQEQLDGGEPEHLLPHAEYQYQLGFSEKHARQMLNQMDRALEFGVGGHQFELNLHVSTLSDLAGWFQLDAERRGGAE